MTTNTIGYVVAIGLGLMLLFYVARERRWWSWLQVAGLALLAMLGAGQGELPGFLVAVGTYLGPPILVAGVVAWRLYHDAGWFTEGGRFAPKRVATDAGG